MDHDHSLLQCFSTGVPQNLRVLPVASKGSAESNRETRTKRHLRPLDAFSWLLVRPKCICGQGSTPNLARVAYSTPPDPLACCPITKNLFPALGLRPRISQFPPRQISGTPMGYVSNQNCCKGFRFKENVEKHCNTI